MQNICFFNSIKFWGGGEKLQLENAIEFQKKNYNIVMLVQKDSPLWKKAKTNNIRTEAITVENLSFLSPMKIAKVASFYKRNAIDTVIFTTSQDLKLGALAAKIAGVKNIVYLRGLAVPIKASFINRYIFKSALTHIISNSEETKRNILKYLSKYIDNDKVHTIYHGISLSNQGNNPTPKLEEIEAKGHGIILGNAGRLTKQKGQDKLIEIARKLKAKGLNYTLFIAGIGELEKKLESTIQKYELQDNVVLLGFVENMEAFMNSLDIFLLSSIWEGFGFVIVEAMKHKLPVVAFDVSSNPEIISANKSGYLIEYPDIVSFADHTALLIENKNLRKKIGQAGFERFREHFVLEDRITELENYILGK